MAITFAVSADKHGVPHEDAMHAMVNAYYSEQEFDVPRVPGHSKPTLFIGPPRKLGPTIGGHGGDSATSGYVHLPRDGSRPEDA